MLNLTITPRFCELDGLNHINNAVYLEWFEQARIPLFKIFTPDLDVKKWRLIIARNEIDYLAPLQFGEQVTIKTYLEKIGSSSMTIVHECWADQTKVAAGKTVMIHYDYQNNQSVPIDSKARAELEQHLHQP